MSRGVQDLVERQVRRWQIERPSVALRSRAPCVALSRLPGSGAAELAAQVAEWLDYGCFGIEIVDEIAKHAHIRRELVADLDEHVRSTLDRYVMDLFRQRPFKESDYLKEVVHTVSALGERGMAVILGRGAPFILEPELALRVLVVASRKARVARIADERGVAEQEAAELLAHEESERREFYQQQFGVDPDDPAGYDLTVNTATLGKDAAAALIVEALRRRFPA